MACIHFTPATIGLCFVYEQIQQNRSIFANFLRLVGEWDIALGVQYNKILVASTIKGVALVLQLNTSGN